MTPFELRRRLEHDRRAKEIAEQMRQGYKAWAEERAKLRAEIEARRALRHRLPTLWSK